MRNFRMSWWFLIITFLSFTFTNLSEAKHEKKLSSAVVGTVYCDTCFQEDFSKTSHFISGALVAVKCGGTSSKPSFREEVKTNEHGQFIVHLPFSVTKHVKKIKGCSVKLISSSEPYCAVASTATSSSFHLKSREQGTQIFSAGFVTFKPLKQPTLCNQKPSVHNSKQFSSKKSLTPTQILDPPMPFLPPIDQGQLPPLPELSNLPPLPQLPTLPQFPGVPNFPPATKKSTQSKTADPLKTSKLSNGMVAKQQIFSPIPLLPSPPPSILPPNPFQPPPSILPPNPLQPPPSILPPNPLQPSPSAPLINLPPIPGLTPPSPFQPSPGIPGIPPAASSTMKISP